MNECLENGGDEPGALPIKANCMEMMDDYAGAFEMYSRLIELGSTDFELYEAAIQCAYMCDRYDEMEELSQKALASGLSEDQVVSAKKWLGIAQLEMKIRRSSHSLWSFSELIRMQSLKRAEIEAAETHFIQND